MAGTEQSLRLLREVDPWWVVAGVALEALSLVSYSLITRRVLRGSPPRFSWLLRSDLTGYGLGRIPAGAKESPSRRIVLRHPGPKTLLLTPSARDAGGREGITSDDDSAQ